MDTMEVLEVWESFSEGPGLMEAVEEMSLVSGNPKREEDDEKFQWSQIERKAEEEEQEQAAALLMPDRRNRGEDDTSEENVSMELQESEKSEVKALELQSQEHAQQESTQEMLAPHNIDQAIAHEPETDDDGEDGEGEYNSDYEEDEEWDATIGDLANAAEQQAIVDAEMKERQRKNARDMMSNEE